MALRAALDGSLSVHISHLSRGAKSCRGVASSAFVHRETGRSSPASETLLRFEYQFLLHIISLGLE